MTDVIIIERCCYCHRNLSKDRLNYSPADNTYFCKDTEDCLEARSEVIEPEVLTGSEQEQNRYFNRSFNFHYKQSGCGGALMGFLVGISVFFGSWIYAIKTYGWFLGLALGWIPSLFLSVFAAMFWPVAILVFLWLILFYDF